MHNTFSERTLAEKGGAMIRSTRHLAIPWWCIALLVVLSGCATTRPQLTEHEKANLGTIGVTAARFTPAGTIQGPRRSGALAGVAIGGVGLGAAAAAACTPQPLMVMTCPTAILLSGMIGAAAGGLLGSQVEAQIKGKEMAAAAPLPLEEHRVQVTLRDRVIQRARATTPYSFVPIGDPGPSAQDDQSDYRALLSRGIDTVLEISVLHLGTEQRPSGLLALEMTGRARVVRVADGAMLAQGTYAYRSDERKYETWIDREAEVLRTSLEAAYTSLSEQMVIELFSPREAPKGAPYEPAVTATATNVAPAAEQPHTTAPSMRDVLHYRLRPQNPELRRCVMCASGKGIGGIEFVELDSATPTLAWESFPKRGEPVIAQGAAAGKIENVSYDVALHSARFDEKAAAWVPGEVFYARERLALPSHRVESPLAACTRYFWTFRARFTLDAQEKATEWMGEHPRPSAADGKSPNFNVWAALDTLAAFLPGSGALAALAREPSSYYYRFITPAAKASDQCPRQAT